MWCLAEKAFSSVQIFQKAHSLYISLTATAVVLVVMCLSLTGRAPMQPLPTCEPANDLNHPIIVAQVHILRVLEPIQDTNISFTGFIYEQVFEDQQVRYGLFQPVTFSESTNKVTKSTRNMLANGGVLAVN